MPEWWRDAVFYEIYVRSFADSNGDGVGDLTGIRQRLPYLRDFGVDAVWLTPFYPSPGVDHGYDVANYVDVDPLFGTLADFDDLVAAAHELDIRLIVDIVPNHTSKDHPWFADDRSRYVTVSADNGPPNNWPSNWGGSAWTLDEARGEYYLHLFAPEQPDLDWHNERVRADFDAILRFWLDRGVDGFRIDVAQGLVKDASLADEPEPLPVSLFSSDWRTAIDQPEVHEIYRDWRRLVDSYDGDRVLVGEIVFSDPARVAPYLRPDELQLAFNFSLVFQPWDAEAIRSSIDESLAALPIVNMGVREPRRDGDRHALRRARGASGGAAPSRPARAGVPVPGPRARTRGGRLARRPAPGPDLHAHPRRAEGARRVPRAGAVDARPAGAILAAGARVVVRPKRRDTARGRRVHAVALPARDRPAAERPPRLARERSRRAGLRARRARLGGQRRCRPSPAAGWRADPGERDDRQGVAARSGGLDSTRRAVIER